MTKSCCIDQLGLIQLLHFVHFYQTRTRSEIDLVLERLRPNDLDQEAEAEEGLTDCRLQKIQK